MAFVTEKTLFIHVQKTGGMTVRRILYRIAPLGRESGDSERERHYGLPELRATHPGIEAGRTSFGFVRHPVTWFMSRYAYAKQSGFETQLRHRGTAASLWLASCMADSFEDFIELMLARYPGIATQTMFRMLGLWSSKPVDRIGRMESLYTDLQEILDAAGESIDINKVSQSARINATDRAIRESLKLSAELRARILKAEMLLCNRFGYH